MSSDLTAITSRVLADPSALDPFTSSGDLQVVIETPRNSRNKYAYHHERHVLVLKKVLPTGMLFPFDFGFVPSTLAEDGDPIDVLVLMDEPTVPGVLLEARLIGVIEGEDVLEGGKTQRNDRLLAIATVSETYEQINDVSQLPEKMVESIKQFFATYPRLLAGKVYTVLACKGPAEARKLVEEAHRNAS